MGELTQFLFNVLELTGLLLELPLLLLHLRALQVLHVGIVIRLHLLALVQSSAILLQHLCTQT